MKSEGINKDKINKKFRLSDKLNLKQALMFTGKFIGFLAVLFILFSFISQDYYAFVFGLSKPVVEYFHPSKEITLDNEKINSQAAGSFTNLLPFIALVLAASGISGKQRIKVIFSGGIILLLIQVAFMALTLSIPLEIAEKELAVNKELSRELDGIWMNLSAEKEAETITELERLKKEGVKQTEISGIIEKLRKHECEQVSDEKIRALCTELMNEYREKEDALKQEKQKEIKASLTTRTLSSFLGGAGMIIFPFIIWVILCLPYLTGKKPRGGKEAGKKKK